MFRFANPVAFLLIGLIFFLRRKGSRHILFPSINHLNKNFYHLVYIIPRALVLLFLIIAIARPQLANVRRDIEKEGIDIILCIDTSGSMDALDFKIGGQRVNRLEVVKRVVSDFIKKRDGDRIGLVAFGTDAVTRIPLSTDYNLIGSAVSEMWVGMAGDSTSIGVALGLSLKRLEKIKGKSKIVILLTDGVSNSGSITPETAREMARGMNVKVYTIGVGTTGEAPFMMETMFGKKLVNQEVELDETTLEQIAEATGGRYFNATYSEGLEKIYDEIDRIEKTSAKTREYMTYQELYPLPLWTAFFLLLAELLLLNTRFQRV